MSTELMIVGAGAQARYIIDTVGLSAEARIVGLVDVCDNPDFIGRKIDGVEVLYGVQRLYEEVGNLDCAFTLAVSDLDDKRRIARELTQAGARFHRVVHPRACISGRAEIGEGCVINAGVVVETGARIGNHVVIHSGTVIEHDVEIGDLSNIAPGVTTAGRVSIGTAATVFSGAVLTPGVRIGDGAVVGAGAVVLRDVDPSTTVVGVPASPLR